MQRSVASILLRRAKPSCRPFSDSTRRRRDVTRLWTVGSFPIDDKASHATSPTIYDTWGMLSSLPTSQGYGYTSALHIIGKLPKSAPSTATTAAAPSTSSNLSVKSVVLP
ncbi:hypothetical protein H257_19300 [Aphanomyces astaci]|uniref:Uncharacterized protein n=1 Tax=Aphanomyces astaci TaxID=112090 RepID=W4FA20_APHAT|nr:hypothetical protein H257_19300 [Aphanomyces astaci]ETV63769.1 hypothetical protein H257_19300 [Aphanomyces astaci]|eukprot:XP_009846748.1 hypothetical protein H257_19300 [Aphanomyces astaci]